MQDGFPFLHHLDNHFKSLSNDAFPNFFPNSLLFIPNTYCNDFFGIILVITATPPPLSLIPKKAVPIGLYT